MSTKPNKSQDSSVVEQSLRKGKVVGSNPTLGSEKKENIIEIPYSRRAKIETKKNTRKAILYVLISLLAAAAIIFFGLNLLTKYTSFFTNLRSSQENEPVEDTTPPPPPLFQQIQDEVNDSDYQIKGRTEPGAKVKLYVNNREQEVIANTEGEFSYSFELNLGKNQYYAIAEDSSGNASAQSETISVIYDNEAPELEIRKPEDGSEYFGSSERQINIEGQTEETAQVTINGKWAVVDNDGKFSYLLSLQDGENTFNIISTDKAGNKTEQEITVNFNP